MTWLIVIIIAAVIMGAIGYFSSKDGAPQKTEKEERMRWQGLLPEHWDADMFY